MVSESYQVKQTVLDRVNRGYIRSVRDKKGGGVSIDEISAN